MNSGSAADAYRAASFDNAPPLELVRRMYAGTLRHLEAAQNLEGNGQAAAFNEHLAKADALICELRVALDREAAPELVGQLTSLYLFCEERIARALETRANQPLSEAAGVLTTLEDAWRRLEVPPVVQ